MGYGYLSLEAFWPQYNSTEFVCTLAERDDEAVRGVFEVECLRLPKAVLSSKDETSRKIVKGNMDSGWKVAHQGPTPVSKMGWGILG